MNENLESTPLAEDGFLYVVDLWGVVYKIDSRSGDVGRIVWRMDPGQEKVPDLALFSYPCFICAWYYFGAGEKTSLPELLTLPPARPLGLDRTM